MGKKKSMKISNNIWNHAWKITLTVALAVGGYFGFTPDSQKAQDSDKPANTSSTSATGVEGGIHINNYPSQSPSSQPVAQPGQQNSSSTEESIPKEQKKIISQNNTQTMGDDNTNSPQTMGKDNEVNIYSETNEVEKQTNIERNTQTGQGSQYFEDAGTDNTFCSGNEDTACSNDGTINNNTAE